MCWKRLCIHKRISDLEEGVTKVMTSIEYDRMDNIYDDQAKISKDGKFVLIPYTSYDGVSAGDPDDSEYYHALALYDVEQGRVVQHLTSEFYTYEDERGLDSADGTNTFDLSADGRFITFCTRFKLDGFKRRWRVNLYDRVLDTYKKDIDVGVTRASCAFRDGLSLSDDGHLISDGHLIHNWVTGTTTDLGESYPFLNFDGSSIYPVIAGGISGDGCYVGGTTWNGNSKDAPSGDGAYILPNPDRAEYCSSLEEEKDPTGDFNCDGSIDAADYSMWRDAKGSFVDLNEVCTPDANRDGVVDQLDYDIWRSTYISKRGRVRTRRSGIRYRTKDARRTSYSRSGSY